MQLSIIIPVYNAEATLAFCLQTVCNQSFDDFEVLLVNDGSTDRSGTICDEYARVDNRIEVIHKSNGGVSSARNLGMARANGEFITFIDADDTIAQNYFQTLLDHKTYELVVTSASSGPADQTKILPDITAVNAFEISHILSNYFASGFAHPWGKLYRTEILRKYDLQFNLSLSIGEDTLFVNEYIANINTLKTLPYIGYFYTKGRKGHLSRKAISYDTFIESLDRILPSFSALEEGYSIDLRLYRYNLIQFFMHRYMSNISRLNLHTGASALKDICELDAVRETFHANLENQKGKLQIIFDWLAQRRYYFVMTVMYKMIGKNYF